MMKNTLILILLSVLCCTKQLTDNQQKMKRDFENELSVIRNSKLILSQQTDVIINLILNNKNTDEQLDIGSYTKFFNLLDDFDRQINSCNDAVFQSKKIIKKLTEEGVELEYDPAQLEPVDHLTRDTKEAKVKEMTKNYSLRNKLTLSEVEKIHKFLYYAWQ